MESINARHNKGKRRGKVVAAIDQVWDVKFSRGKWGVKRLNQSANHRF